MQTFKDGQLFREQNFEGENELCINLQCFFDDFTNVKYNFKSNKFCVVLLGLCNLPLKHTAKRSDQFLSLIAKRKCVDEIGIDAFLKPLLDDILSLDQKRMTLGVHDDIVVRVKIAQFVGDNLGSHEAMRLTRSFRSGSCRHCMITYQQLQLLDPELVMSDRPLHESHCMHPHFNSTYNYSCDIFHDLCHGVILKLMCFILVSYYNGDYTELLNRYKSVPAKNGHLEDIHKTTGKLLGTGMQIFEFFLLFSFLDNKVPRSSTHWRLYTLLREIVLFCFHPVVHQSELKKFHSNVIDFQLEFFANIVFPTKDLCKSKKVTFVMKIHYLVHYVKAIYKSGPLLNSSTLKYERCLSGFKDFLLGSRNRKNQCFSIASWFALTFDRSAFADQNEYNLVNSVQSSEIRSNFEADLAERFLVEGAEFLTSCGHENVNYNLGDLFLSGFDSQNNPLFIQIRYLIKQPDQLRIVGHVFVTESYDPNRCVYLVRETIDFCELEPQYLEYYRPVHFFENRFALKDFKSKDH